MSHRPGLCVAALLMMLLGGPAVSQASEWGPPDTVRVAPPAAPVPYRSRAESLASVPGRLLYLPAWAALGIARGASIAVWDWRLPERAAAALTFADGRVGIRPESSTQIGTGARLFYRASSAHFEVTTSVGRDGTERQHHLFRVESTVWSLDGGVEREPEERFYGIGMDTRTTDLTRFTQERAKISLSTHRRLNEHVSVSAAAGYRQTRVGPPDGVGPVLPLSGTIFGVGTTTGFVEINASTRLEFVDHPGSPRHGYILRSGVGLHRAIDAPASYVSVNLAGERFLELFHGRAVSVRVGTDWRLPLGHDEVPFFDLATVGGNQVVRGFQRGRFRDRGAAIAALMYKVPVWRRLDALWFYEGGRTFSGVDEVSVRGWRRSWGTGMRLYVPSRLLFEQRVAFSDEEWRLLFLARTDF